MEQPLTELTSVPRVGDRTYEAIRLAILSGRFAPGSKLTVDHLARQLKVSRTPVKEALVRLEREGLVRVIPRHGAFVEQLSRSDVEELYDLREVCEGLAARKAATRATEADLARLRELVDQAAQCVRDGDRVRYSDLDVAFHGLIVEMSGSRRLTQVLEGLRSQTRLMMATSVVLPGRLRLSHQEHQALLQALSAREPARAEEVARAHVRAVRAAMLEHLDGAGPSAGKGGGQGAV